MNFQDRDPWTRKLYVIVIIVFDFFWFEGIKIDKTLVENAWNNDEKLLELAKWMKEVNWSPLRDEYVFYGTPFSKETLKAMLISAIKGMRSL